MAKWIFVLLILLNVFMYAYQNFFGDTRHSVSHTPEQRVAEVSPDSLKLLPPDWVPKEDVTLSIDEATLSPPSDAIHSNAELERDKKIVSDDASIKQTIPAPHDVLPESDKIVEERRGSDKEEHPDVLLSKNNPSTMPYRRICYKINRLDEQQHQKVVKILQKHGLSHYGQFQSRSLKKQAEGAVDKSTKYQVYIEPPMKDFSSIEAKLQQQGIEHFALRSEGKISLGVFRVKENADQLKQKVQALGFDTKIANRTDGFQSNEVTSKSPKEYLWTFRVKEDKKDLLYQAIKPYGAKSC
jgi:hypothetical protein